MVILGFLAASILLAAMAWGKGWKKKALGPVLCLFIITVIDAQLGWALGNTPGFSYIVGIICIAWVVYMVFRPPKTAALKK